MLQRERKLDLPIVDNLHYVDLKVEKDVSMFKGHTLSVAHHRSCFHKHVQNGFIHYFFFFLEKQ